MRANWKDEQDHVGYNRDFARNAANILRALSVLSAVTAIVGMLLAIWRAPSIIENDHRLAPTFAVAAGYRLYYGPQEGPDLSTLYGPVTALAYAPALWAPTPLTAVCFATLLSLIFFLSPMFLIADKGTKAPRWLTYSSVLGLAGSLTFLSSSLQASSILVHADAPALAAGGIACWLCIRSTRADNAWYAISSGLLASASVMCKQNMVPLMVALVLWWWCCFSLKRAIQFTVAAVGALIVIWSGILLASSSFEAAWFNWFYLPTHQPFDKAMFFPVLESLARTCVLYLLPVAVLTVWSVSSGWREWLSRPVILLVWTGICLFPTSLLGRLKAGGSENALSPAIYFFALAAMLVLSTHLVGILEDERGYNLSAFAMLILLFGVYAVTNFPRDVYSTLKKPPRSAMESVYAFSRAHPGEVYFPQFPLTVLMAEGRLYHFSWGLTDRRAAGYPVSETHFLENIPVSARRMALLPWVRSWESDIYSRCREGNSMTSDPALPGFELCTVR